MAAVPLKTYDPSQVIVTLMTSVLDGFAEGTFVSITTPDLYDTAAGVNTVARVKSTDGRAQIELSFLQTSPSNLILSGIKTLDVGGNGVGPCIVKDASGNTLFSALTCWIRKAPDITFGTEIETWTWTLECDSYTAVEGGN